MSAQSYSDIGELPSQLAVFPLPGALLFPRWALPLNIFEPRYLNMVDDAMSGTRMIGMVQSVGGDPAVPGLAEIGCAGRITSFSETDDGRYLITLTGVCRFAIGQELKVKTPYRQVLPDWEVYAGDLSEPPEVQLPPREKLVSALETYISRKSMKADWEAVGSAPMETLINALSAGCPFTVMEKQALLEAPTISDRCETLIALLDMDMSGEDPSTLQ